MIINDLQMPFHDPVALDLVFKVIGAIEPDAVVLNGDVVDCYGISEFSKNPVTTKDLNEEIELAGKLMARLADIESKLWIGGNHEDRLRRLVWNRAPALGGIPALEFPALFNLADYGFEWLPYGAYHRIGKLTITHGDLVRKDSGATARAHLESYGTNVLIGHTHRLGAFYRTRLGKPFVAYENGCLCSMTPEWINNPDWQQGFAVVHSDPKSGFFNVQQLPILRDDKGSAVCFFGGERFSVKAKWGEGQW